MNNMHENEYCYMVEQSVIFFFIVLGIDILLRLCYNQIIEKTIQGYGNWQMCPDVM